MAGVELLYGPWLIGVFLNMILYGMLVVQMFTYYQAYRKRDSPWIKFLVLYLFVVETINTGLNMVMMYEPLILENGSEDATTFFPILFTSEPITIVAVSTPIQFFIAWRIGKISQSWWVPAVICLLALSSLAGGIWTAIAVQTIRRFARKPELHTPALVWFVTAAAADVLITVSLVRSLYIRRTGHSPTDAVITRIITMTIQTGMLTAVAALGDVIFFLVLPHTTINFIWDLALTKLYANSLMSTLNARASWNNQLTAHRTNALFEDSPVQPEAHRYFPDVTSSGRGRSNVYELDTSIEFRNASRADEFSPTKSPVKSDPITF
ncbi:hypothetical protein Hypma_001628 [Hypsizygus marmoreus]|uniref:DUF6534 domain-containing protein n=1 Tax=Hypsizygus marmoreus TaxID=39966 RepID=A0A369JAK0_HYPMA|nr:hypothetical protein Hypma_001628 [Hypsizygus marmoreus]